MVTFLQYQHLTELWDRPLPYHWHPSKDLMDATQNEECQAEFTVPTPTPTTYQVTFYLLPDRRPSHSGPRVGAWNITFHQQEPIKGSTHFYNNFDIIGKTGAEVPIFSTVIAIVTEFITTLTPARITMQSKRTEPTRTQLYRTLLRSMRIKPVLADYTIGERAVEDETEFTLTHNE
jgi:hypothetical protein